MLPCFWWRMERLHANKKNLTTFGEKSINSNFLCIQTVKVGTGTYLELNWHGKLTTELITFKMYGWTNSGLRNCWAKISKIFWYIRKETASQVKVKLIENHLWKITEVFLRKENTFRQACHFLCYWILLKLACHIQLVTSKYCSAFYSREVGKTF